MVAYTLDFTTQPQQDPFISIPSGWAMGVGSAQGRTYNISATSWTAKSVQATLINTTAMQGTWIKSTARLSTNQTNGAGACMLDAAGNGYMISATTAGGHSLYKVAASQISGSALATVTAATTPVVNLQRHSLRRNTVTNELQILIEGVLAASVVDATYAPTYGGCVSRYGYLQSVEIEYTPDQTVDTINGGSPFTASQVGSSAATAGFTGTGSMSSITATWGAYSLPITNIGGTLAAPTFDKGVRVDGQVYPKSGETLNLTFTKDAQTASKTHVFNKNSDEVEVTVATPIIGNPKYLFGAIFAGTGRTAVNGDKAYHKIPTVMLTNPNSPFDVISNPIDPDGRIRVYVAGSFPVWVYTEATKINYYYYVTVSAAGDVVDVTPEPFTFGSVAGVAPNAVTPAASSITVAGVTADTDVLAVATGGLSYRVSTNGGSTFGSWTTASTNVRLGYVIEARVTASASTSTLVTGTLTIGGVAGTLQVTTRAGINIPNQMIFASFIDSELLTEHTSSTQTVAGMDTGEVSAFTVANGTYSKNGGAFISTAGSLQNGDTFALKGTSDTYFGRSKDVTLTATNGSVASIYRITNKLDPLLPTGGGSTVVGQFLTGYTL